MHENKTFFLYNFCNVLTKTGYFNTGFVSYSIKIQTDINQNTRKNHNFFEKIFLGWAGPGPTIVVWAGDVRPSE